jgi:hypothetical protein
MSDEWQAELNKIIDELQTSVEGLAQKRAGTHAAFYAKAQSDEWKRNARFESELQHEIEFLGRSKKRSMNGSPRAELG